MIYVIISPDVLLTVFVIETDGKLNEQQGGERRRVTKGDSYLQCKAENRNDLVTRRERKIFLVLKELDKQLLREEPACPFKLHFLFLFCDSCVIPVIARHSRAGGQPAPQQLCVLAHRNANTHTSI